MNYLSHTMLHDIIIAAPLLLGTGALVASQAPREPQAHPASYMSWFCSFLSSCIKSPQLDHSVVSAPLNVPSFRTLAAPKNKRVKEQMVVHHPRRRLYPNLKHIPRSQPMDIPRVASSHHREETSNKNAQQRLDDEQFFFSRTLPDPNDSI